LRALSHGAICRAMKREVAASSLALDRMRQSSAPSDHSAAHKALQSWRTKGIFGGHSGGMRASFILFHTSKYKF